MAPALHAISSMATRALLAELAHDHQAQTGVEIRLESVGGVDAARRVQAGEAFDAVLLAADAIERLIASGHVQAGSRVDWVRSPVALAVRAGAPVPDVGSETALRQAVCAARSLGVSTGPSGTALLQLFERWGVLEALRPRLVTPPPGVPVGSLVASGAVELGFQQLSELLALPGIALLGPLPSGCAIETVFSAGLCTASAQPDAVRAWFDFLASPASADCKRRHGMAPL
ncbi:ABC-type molybdate transport system, periplasmic component [Serpentinimonas raichei]|uniref:ABC-type molybdate transport system, periplasmic component n=1 Tax=Serpentinimonas raichei TaxID=1458425 RepID=A0A060NQL5_9BURK|nr:substrate-binding domain-containing protein [Serpentinimonas raichei]BAO81209.1 ABC-type molybdate transport system, periplasmic component [Serpentinimonas raichei]